VPTIQLDGQIPAAQQLMTTVAQSFQQTLAHVVEQSATQATQMSSVIAASVAQAVASAQSDSRERDMRLILQLQRETLEEAHKKELERLKRERTEGPEDLLCSARTTPPRPPHAS
jgi:hypothetical protein